MLSIPTCLGGVERIVSSLFPKTLTLGANLVRSFILYIDAFGSESGPLFNPWIMMFMVAKFMTLGLCNLMVKSGRQSSKELCLASQTYVRADAFSPNLTIALNAT